jgi:hypothetical protein
VSISRGKLPMSHSNSITQLGHGLTSKARKGCDEDKEGEYLYPMFLGPHSPVRVWAVWEEQDEHIFFVGRA